MTIVDSFEDQNLNGWSGDTGSVGIDTDAHDGSYGLLWNSAGTIYNENISFGTSGSPAGVWVKTGVETRFLFALNWSTNNNLNGYAIGTKPSGDYGGDVLNIYKINDGTFNLIDGVSDTNLYSGTWYQLHVDVWRDDGTIRGHLATDNDDYINGVSMTDTDYKSGFIGLNGGTDDVYQDSRADQVFRAQTAPNITIDGDQVTEVTIDGNVVQSATIDDNGL